MNFPFTWLNIGNGRLAIWHRPKWRVIPYLREPGCSRIVTLLSEREGACNVGRAVEESGIAWTWLPLRNGRPPAAKDSALILTTLQFLSRQLDQGESILIHCSAGIHRTGMIAYALLRLRGVSAEQVLIDIEKMRAITAQGLQPEHVTWAESIAQSY